MKKVAFQNEVLHFLDELVIALLEKEYFGSEEGAEAYLNWLYDTSLEKLPNKIHYATPQKLAYYISKLKVTKHLCIF